MAFWCLTTMMTVLCLGPILCSSTARPSADSKTGTAIVNAATPNFHSAQNVFPRPQKTIPSSKSPIAVGDFQFRIIRVAFERTAMGFVPEDMGPTDWLMFVEFELLSGHPANFKKLQIVVSDGRGRKSKPVVLAACGMIEMLSPMTMTNTSSDYRPESTTIAWAYVVPERATVFYLNFPTGEVISLAPLIKDTAKSAP